MSEDKDLENLDPLKKKKGRVSLSLLIAGSVACLGTGAYAGWGGEYGIESMIASTAVGIFFSASQARKDYTRPYDKSEMGL